MSFEFSSPKIAQFHPCDDFAYKDCMYVVLCPQLTKIACRE